MTLQKTMKVGMALGVAATVGYVYRKEIQHRLNKVIKRRHPIAKRLTELEHPSNPEEAKMVSEGAVQSIRYVNHMREKEVAK